MADESYLDWQSGDGGSRLTVAKFVFAPYRPPPCSPAHPCANLFVKAYALAWLQEHSVSTPAIWEFLIYFSNRKIFYLLEKLLEMVGIEPAFPVFGVFNSISGKELQNG
jgi:hypothetical protein